VRFDVVIGYLPNVDRFPRDAERLGLRHRCAFVMHTDSPLHADMVFNVPLYHAMIAMVWAALRCDRAELEFLPSRRTARSLAELETLVLEHTRAEEAPVPELTLFRGSAAVGFVESQPWANVGGPALYHDSYTVAVFTSSDVSDVFVARAHELSTRCETELVDVVRMDPQPPIPSLLDRLRAALGL